MLFYYSGYYRNVNRKFRGFVDAKTKQDAINLLNENDFVPDKLKTVLFILRFFYRIYLYFALRPPFYTKKNVKDFNFIVSSLLKSGLSITESFKVVLAISDARTRYFVNIILNDLNGGKSLEESFSRFSYIFPEEQIKKFSLPDKNNKLISIFDIESEKSDNFYRTVIVPSLPALISLLFVLIATVFVSNYYYAPMIKLSNSIEIPINENAKFLLKITQFLQEHFFASIGIVVVIVMTIRLIYSFQVMKWVWHNFILLLPFFSGLVRLNQRIVFLRIIKNSMISGSHIYEALPYAYSSISNMVLKNELQVMGQRLLAGESIGVSIRDVSLLRGIYAQILKTSTAGSDFLRGIDKLLSFSLDESALNFIWLAQIIRFFSFGVLIILLLWVATIGIMLYVQLLYFVLSP
jgi:type II secretory pathway component PulF